MKQMGFTLIEILVALAVGSLILVGGVGAINQVVIGTSRTNSEVVALTDVHQAAFQIKKDLEMAQLGGGDFLRDGSVVITLTGIGSTATLGWTDFTSFDLEENKDHISSYELVDGKLQRTYDEGTTVVGRNVTFLQFTQDPEGTNDRVIGVVITATEDGLEPRSETLEFSVWMRAVGLE